MPKFRQFFQHAVAVTAVIAFAMTTVTTDWSSAQDVGSAIGEPFRQESYAPETPDSAMVQYIAPGAGARSDTVSAVTSQVDVVPKTVWQPVVALVLIAVIFVFTPLRRVLNGRDELVTAMTLAEQAKKQQKGG